MDPALVAAMLDEPDSDDVARAVADHFDRTDPPRAEICRIDIDDRRRSRMAWIEALRGQTPSVPLDDTGRFERRRALFEQHGPRWRAELPPGIEPYDWAFERGAWTHLTITTTWLCEHGDELFAEHPISSLALDDRGDLATALARPCLRRVRSLGIASIYSGVAEALAAATTLTSLESLRAFIDDADQPNDRDSIKESTIGLGRLARHRQLLLHFSREDSRRRRGGSGRDRAWPGQSRSRPHVCVRRGLRDHPSRSQLCRAATRVSLAKSRSRGLAQPSTRSARGSAEYFCVADPRHRVH